MKLLTMSLAAALLLTVPAASASMNTPGVTVPTAEQVPTIPTEVLAATHCDPKDPIDDWLLCVVSETITFPPWVWDTVTYLANIVFTVYYRVVSDVCFQYEHFTGDPCPL